ncbi:MAG: carboxypeptidase regulatory-like domain-containing protein [Pyrinomonadaceae bacterium]
MKNDLLPSRKLTALVVLFLASVTPIQAQDTVTGAFEGIVSDSQTGVALKGAAVEIINEQTGLSHSLSTDFRGRFYQGLLIPGVYRVRVSMPGYQTRDVLQRLKITYTGEVVPVPVALDPAPATVTPTASPSPTVTLGVEDTEVRSSIVRSDGRRGGSFNEEEVSTLPLGATTIVRTFDELTLLLPGIAPPPQTLGSVAGPGVGAGVGSAGQFAVNGLRSRANNFTVDGSDNNDEDIGVRRQGFVALIPQPIESIKEYQAITLLAPAQFGRNIGAQVNAVSKSGGNETHGTAYTFFNSSQLNARNFFDTNFGTGATALRAAGKPVLLNGRQIIVTNQSGGEDSFTLTKGGLVLGGPLVPNEPGGSGRSMFYFISAEGQNINATKEESFAVPTVEQRGIFGSGATGLSADPFTGQPVLSFPATVSGDAIYSLYPFPNNPNGIYGLNTFTQILPASEQGKVLSGKVDANFKLGQRLQGFTSRYNLTDDFRDIPVTGGAVFSSIRPNVRTQNFSNFLNSELSSPDNTSRVFNQLRASYGRTRLVFEELRDREFLRPSRLASTFRGNESVFLLNAPLRVNDTLPGSANVLYDRFFNFNTEDILGPVGQVSIAGFSPVGVDVFNFPQRRVNNTYQLADTLTIRFANHALTFGADVRRTELNSDLPVNARPLITFVGAPRVRTNAQGGFELSGFISAIDLAAASAPSGFFQSVTPGASSAINLRYYQWNYFAQNEWRMRPDLTLSFGLRYEYNSPPRETTRRIENTFTDPSLALVPGLRRFLDGRTEIFDADRNNFGPRVGLAYSPELFGPNRTSVFRLGYGIFFDQALGAVVSQSRNVFPNFLTLNLAGGIATQAGVGFVITDPSLPFFPCRDSRDNVRFFPVTQPGTLNALNPQMSLSCLVSINTSFPGGFGFTLPARELEMPTAHHYAFTFEQQLRDNLVISLGYVGTQARHLLRLTTPNLGPNAFLFPTRINVAGNQPNVFGFAAGPGQRIDPSGTIIGSRPTATAGAVNIYESSANSRYDSMQVHLRGRFPRAVQYQIAYTLSRAFDDVSDVFDLAGASALPQNSFTFAGERAPANFDARHRLSYSFVYDLPALSNRSKGVRIFLGGFQLASLGRFQTAQPFTVNTIWDVNLDGNLTDRLNTTQGLQITGNRSRPLILTVPDPLSLTAPIGQDGQIDRNSFRAGNILELDLALAKSFAFTSQQRLTVRAEIFNLIDRANFGIPIRFLGAVGFGQAVNTITPGRRLQFALKYSF